MGDTSPLSTFTTKIDLCNSLMTVENAQLAIDLAGTYGYVLAGKGTAHFVRPALQRDLAGFVYLPNCVSWPVLHGWQHRRIRSLRCTISRSRYVHLQRFVRTLMIVDRPEL